MEIHCVLFVLDLAELCSMVLGKISFEKFLIFFRSFITYDHLPSSLRGFLQSFVKIGPVTEEKIK